MTTIPAVLGQAPAVLARKALAQSPYYQQADYYSAVVSAESNFCLVVLISLILALYSSFVFAITRLCFGRLRAIEVETLTERAWFATIETCLVMAMFRNEFGAWFLAMFTSLVTGKVWGWICDSRVETLERQPPINPQLFHIRLIISLAISFLYDSLILRYTIQTAIRQAEQGLMVMFVFEFGLLAVSSCRTALQYLLYLIEQYIVKQQMMKIALERRAEAKQQREELLAERTYAAGVGDSFVNQSALPDENDVQIEFEVPGWVAKGEWVLWLDLATDVIKLTIYIAFFFTLLKLFGFPIPVIRDLRITAHRVYKQLRAILRYEEAIEEINRFPDANQDDISHESTCIICCEEMRLWDANGSAEPIHRVRPKRLPCGHVLHLGCLSRWLERQKVCPICRNSVTRPPALL